MTSLAQAAAEKFKANPAYDLMKAEGIKTFTWKGRNGSDYDFIDGSSLSTGPCRKGVTPVTVKGA